MKNLLLLCCFALFLSCAMKSGMAFSAESAPAGEIFTTTIGDIEVSMLSEGQSESTPSILIGAVSKDVEAFIPSGKYPSSVNAFLLRMPDKIVLVDTGFGRKLFDHLADLGVSAGDVDVVLITHSHRDHIGGLLREDKAAFPKARVMIAGPEFEWSQAARTALAHYKDRVELIAPGSIDKSSSLPFGGVRAIAAYGHTPGHTLFLIESKGQKLLIWGDLTHVMAIQMPRPDVSVTYDDDPVAAASTRKAVLQYISDNGISVAGMHIAYPGIGRVAADPDQPGGYRFTALSK